MIIFRILFFCLERLCSFLTRAHIHDVHDFQRNGLNCTHTADDSVWFPVWLLVSIPSTRFRRLIQPNQPANRTHIHFVSVPFLSFRCFSFRLVVRFVLNHYCAICARTFAIRFCSSPKNGLRNRPETETTTETKKKYYGKIICETCSLSPFHA